MKILMLWKEQDLENSIIRVQHSFCESCLMGCFWVDFSGVLMPPYFVFGAALLDEDCTCSIVGFLAYQIVP